jgi:anaerobic selenocysteine-containing dehydrogenase
MSGDGPSRRDFLAYSGAAVAGITLGETGRRWLARADARAAAWRDRGVETWATSVCRECPSGCGVRVRLVDDVPVKIEGNPLCPIARGRVCAKGQATIESYFDPDRLVGPAHRIARGGPPRWEPLPWKDAVALAADRLKRAAGTTDGIVVIAAAERGPEAEAWTRFWHAAGARVAWTPLPTADRLRPRLRQLTGADVDPVFHVESASYVLSFGAPLAEDWLSGVWAQRSFGRLRRGSGSSRGRLVQIEGRRSATARKADEWLAVPPERQTALAYGIASALFRENRIDRDRLAPIAGNLASFEHQLTTYYTPDNVSNATGVPVVAILRLARELIATPRPLAIVNAAASDSLADAVFSLNVLVGAIDRAGGLFGRAWDPAPAREDATAVLLGIVDGKIRPSVLLFADSSALRIVGGPTHPETLAERVPFIVSLSAYMDEVSAIADVILPTDLPLESWQTLVPGEALGIDVVPVARPAVARRLDTQDRGALLHGLAVALGGAAEQACDWQSSEEIVRREMKRLGALRRGTPYATSYETDWMEQLESGGWWAAAAASDAAFVERVLTAGGWVDPFFDGKALTDALQAGRGLSFPLPEVLEPPSTVRADGAAAPAAAAYPIALSAFQPSVLTLTGNPNQPSIFELLGQPDSVPWTIWVEMASEDAERLGIADRSRVRIASASDTLEAVAVKVDGMPSGTAALSIAGGQPGGRWSRLMGKDARGLWGGESPVRPCAVRIIRA